MVEVMTRHGTHSGYANGCRCTPCRRGHRVYSRQYRGAVPHQPERDQQLDAPWLLQHFPIAPIARQAWPDDKAAIDAAFSTGVGFAAAADPGSAARPVSQPPGDRAGRASTGDGGVG